MAIIILLLALTVHLLVCAKFDEIAKDKGYSGAFGWIFFTSIAGMIMVASMSDKKQRENQKKIIELLSNEKKDEEKKQD